MYLSASPDYNHLIDEVVSSAPQLSSDQRASVALAFCERGAPSKRAQYTQLRQLGHVRAEQVSGAHEGRGDVAAGPQGPRSLQHPQIEAGEVPVSLARPYSESVTLMRDPGGRELRESA